MMGEGATPPSQTMYAVDTSHNESEQALLAYTMDCLPPGKVK